MKIQDIPDLKGNQYPARLAIAVSQETKRRLEVLRREHGKNTSEMLRMLIEKALDSMAKEVSL